MTMALVLIEVCEANRASTNELFALEDAYPGVSVMETSCGSECELCATAPYVFLNGQIISRDSVEELLQTMKDMLTWLIPNQDETST